MAVHNLKAVFNLVVNPTQILQVTRAQSKKVQEVASTGANNTSQVHPRILKGVGISLYGRFLASLELAAPPRKNPQQLQLLPPGLLRQG